MPSQSPGISALCCPSNGEGLTFGGVPSKRTSHAGIFVLAGGRVIDVLHDAALGERRIVNQLEGIEHATRRHACLAD